MVRQYQVAAELLPPKLEGTPLAAAAKECSRATLLMSAAQVSPPLVSCLVGCSFGHSHVIGRVPHDVALLPCVFHETHMSDMYCPFRPSLALRALAACTAAACRQQWIVRVRLQRCEMPALPAHSPCLPWTQGRSRKDHTWGWLYYGQTVGAGEALLLCVLQPLLAASLCPNLLAVCLKPCVIRPHISPKFGCADHVDKLTGAAQTQAMSLAAPALVLHNAVCCQGST